MIGDAASCTSLMQVRCMCGDVRLGSRLAARTRIERGPCKFVALSSVRARECDMKVGIPIRKPRDIRVTTAYTVTDGVFGSISRV